MKTALALLLLIVIPDQIQNPNEEAVIRVITDNGHGSGVVIYANKDKAYILTAYHVTDGKKEVTILWPDRIALNATLIRESKENDLALYRVARSPPITTYIKISNKPITIGDSVTYCGYARGWYHRWDAIVIGLNERWVMTTKGVIGGDSGGAILNSDGELIGIVYGAHLDNLKRHKDTFGPNRKTILSFVWP